MAESSMKDINLRIKSIKSTKQITKAMELVATSKLSKAKERIEKSRVFHRSVYTAMCDIVSRNNDTSSEYLEKREVKKSCYIVIAGDRGLAGGYNGNVFRLADELMKDKNVITLPIGKRAVDYCKRKNYDIITEDYAIVEQVTVGGCNDISKLLSDCYVKGEFDEVFIIYTNFISVLNQQPTSTKLLPLDDSIHENQEEVKKEFILFEPSSNAVFNAIVPSYLAGMLWGSVCESLTSELGARRTAMESATKSAEEMIEDLSLKYNRARQGAITQEITEIVAGSGLN